MNCFKDFLKLFFSLVVETKKMTMGGKYCYGYKPLRNLRNCLFNILKSEKL